MPRTVDHDQRRAEVATVAARLIATGGLDAVTVRDVADAGGFSTKVVTRYFADKRHLLLHVYRATAGRAAVRLADAQRTRPDDLAACAHTLLPVDAARRQEWAVWLAFWGFAVSDAEFAAEQRSRVRSARRALAEVARSAGSTTAADDARRALVAVHGVAVEALFDRAEWPAARQRAAVDDALRP